MNNAATLLLSLATIVLGIVMIALTIARGGGPFALGILLGVLFILAGGGRLWVQRRL